MQGHLECFDSECYWIADDPWFPWTEINLCKDKDVFMVLCGEYAGEIVIYKDGQNGFELQGEEFTIKCIDRFKVYRIIRGDLDDN